MVSPPSTDQAVVLAFAAAWSRLERRLDGALSSIKGISFAEYRLLHELADAPPTGLRRVDLAEAVGLTPSGVTRALRPLEKLGFVLTAKSDRDARLALASLTGAGRLLAGDASGVVDDVAAQLVARTKAAGRKRDLLIDLLTDLAGG